MIRTSAGRRIRGVLFAGSAAALLAVLSACSGGPNGASTGAANDYGLIGGGDTVQVATTPSMPNTNLENGKFTGFEADMLTEALNRLGLKMTVTTSDFPGMLASVQAGRADIALGNIAWRDTRAANGLLTDPPFYVPQVAVEKAGADIDSVEGLAGHSVGTINGFIFVDLLQKMEGVDLHTYADAASALADVQAGRIDVALLDPLSAVYTVSTRPDLGLTAVTIKTPSQAVLAEHPDYDIFGPVMAAWYLPTDHTELEAALNEQIRAMYADGTTAKLMEKYGVTDPASLLTVSADWAKLFEQQRAAVDRPADWTVPQASQ